MDFLAFKAAMQLFLLDKEINSLSLLKNLWYFNLNDGCTAIRIFLLKVLLEKQHISVIYLFIFVLILDPNRTNFSCHCVQVKPICQRHVPDIMASKWNTALWGDELAASCCCVAGPPPSEPGAPDTTHLLTSWNSLTSVMWWINLKSLGLWVKVSSEHTITHLVLDCHELLALQLLSFCWVF